MLDAVVGLNLTVRVVVLPFVIVIAVLFKLILFTGELTVIIHVAFLPLCVVAVIFAFPEFAPCTTPELVTVATFLFSELHVIFLLSAFVGSIVAFNCKFAPTAIVFSFGFIVIPVGSIGLTVTLHVAYFPF